jgi:cytochrome bd-type quinol oxidase subunit 2
MQNFTHQIKKAALILVLALGLLGPVFSPPASAGLFDNAKSEACKGAQLTDDPVGANCGEDDAEKIGFTIDKVINLISIVVGILSVIMLIISGIRFITANGDSNNITSARNTFIYALVGLIIVAFAQLIVKLVLTRVV